MLLIIVRHLPCFRWPWGSFPIIFASVDRHQRSTIIVLASLGIPAGGLVLAAIGAASKTKWLLWLGFSLPFAMGSAWLLYLSLLMLAALGEIEWDRFLFGWAVSMPFWILIFGGQLGIVLIAIVLIGRIIARIAEPALARFAELVD